ncbi:MAG: histone deacetylase family protein [Maritimibacter sp.]|nr:histone deacetylase family protein [Maritimibacter sp.]
MRAFFDEQQRLHAPAFEIIGGQMVAPYETRDRIDRLLTPLAEAGLCAFEAPRDFGLGPILATHEPALVDFLERAYRDWKAAGFKGDVFATVMPSPHTRLRQPKFIEGEVGFFAASGESAIAEHTWPAVRASAQCAIAAADALAQGEHAAFALCPPPGHHAMKGQFGGYCYLNNAAIAAQYLRDRGCGRVAILDVDFHHGNGTQDIFYARDDVLFLSLHGDPELSYPFFLGYADETGAGAGQGFNRNYPLGPGTDFTAWSTAFDDASGRLKAFAPDALVVSLGLDIFERDPQSIFRIATDDFATIGKRIRDLDLPTVLVMEGGYAVEDLAQNIRSFFAGFSGRDV